MLSFASSPLSFLSSFPFAFPFLQLLRLILWLAAAASLQCLECPYLAVGSSKWHVLPDGPPFHSLSPSIYSCPGSFRPTSRAAHIPSLWVSFPHPRSPISKFWTIPLLLASMPFIRSVASSSLAFCLFVRILSLAAKLACLLASFQLTAIYFVALRNGKRVWNRYKSAIGGQMKKEIENKIPKWVGRGRGKGIKWDKKKRQQRGKKDREMKKWEYSQRRMDGFVFLLLLLLLLPAAVHECSMTGRMDTKKMKY